MLHGSIFDPADSAEEKSLFIYLFIYVTNTKKIGEASAPTWSNFFNSILK